jgi:hypothetical protein
VDQLWCIPITPAFIRLKQEEWEFEASLGCIERPHVKKQIMIIINNEISVDME